MEFRERLYQLRKGRGISQEELAHTVGVSRQAVQKWEAGAATPDLSNLSALADYFAVSLDYLVRGIEPEKPAAPSPQQAVIQNYYTGWSYEFRSRRTLLGLPLVHINLRDRGLCRAKGIIAIGNVATGFLAIGGFSADLLSIGGLGVGLLTLGGLAVGIAAAGGLAAGLLLALGGGAFSLGLALGRLRRQPVCRHRRGGGGTVRRRRRRARLHPCHRPGRPILLRRAGPHPGPAPRLWWEYRGPVPDDPRPAPRGP
ncbi:MAG: helix-turn-helix domain-containing protein [Flavonifractor plautii]